MPRCARKTQKKLIEKKGVGNIYKSVTFLPDELGNIARPLQLVK